MAFWNRKEKKETVNKKREDKIARAKEELASVIADTSRATGISLLKVKARVVVVIDHSRSMDFEYDNGTVQEVLDMFLPFAWQFDDDGEIQVYIFDNECTRLKTAMTADNYQNYVEKEIINKFSYGSTCYSKAVQKVDKEFNDKESKNLPTIVFFVTDGACNDNDEQASDKAFIESSDHGIFFALIGVGSNRFKYLRHLDDLEGRQYDNTGFMQFSDFSKVSSLSVFTNALKDFVPWLKAKGYVS